MGKIGKISPIKKEYDPNERSIEASLAAKGKTRAPFTSERHVPHRERDGKWRTGLDENALYIKKMKPEEQQIEKARVRAERERLEELTGLDLGPTADFYAKMYDDEYGQTTRAKSIRLIDGDNIFNLEDPMEAIAYAWARVHPDIAHSYQDWVNGNVPSSAIKFFVNDDDVETEVEYKKLSLVNKAIRKMEDLTLEKKRKVARLLGLPVTDQSSEHTIYKELDKYIRQTEVTFGEYKGKNSVQMFETFADMKNENIDIHDLAHQVLTHSIYRRKQGGRIYDGELKVFDTKDQMIEFLSDSRNQDDLFALKERLKAAKAVAQD